MKTLEFMTPRFIIKPQSLFCMPLNKKINKYKNYKTREWKEERKENNLDIAILSLNLPLSRLMRFPWPRNNYIRGHGFYMRWLLTSPCAWLYVLFQV